MTDRLTDELRAALDGVDDLEVAARPAVFAAVHEALVAELAELEEV